MRSITNDKEGSHVMTAGPRVLVLAILALPVGYADAQTLPGPGEPGAPQVVAPMPGMSPVDGGAPQCMAEFAKLREEVKLKGMAAKAASQSHVARKEMCEYVTTYAAAEARWIDFVEAGVRTCGIPAGIVNQLQKVHADTEQTRVKICADVVAPNALSPLRPRMHMDDFPTDDGREWRQWRLPFRETPRQR
jgi:hypothetical protein